MAQIKIYGIKEHLIPLRGVLSKVIHECVMEALHFPPDKRAHRFFPMDKENMFYPEGRSRTRRFLYRGARSCSYRGLIAHFDSSLSICR